MVEFLTLILITFCYLIYRHGKRNGGRYTEISGLMALVLAVLMLAVEIYQARNMRGIVPLSVVIAISALVFWRGEKKESLFITLLAGTILLGGILATFLGILPGASE